MRRPREIVDLEPELLVRADDQALRGIGRIHPDRGVIGGIAVSRHGLGLDRGLDDDRGRAGHFAIGCRLACRESQRASHIRERDQLVIGVCVAVVLVGDGEQATVEPGQRARYECKALGLADRRNCAACGKRDRAARFSLEIVDAQDALPDICSEDIRGRGIRAIDRDALDLFVDGAEGRERVDLHRRRVGFRLGGQAPETRRFDRNDHCLGSVVDGAGPGSAAERDATDRNCSDAAVTVMQLELLEVSIVGGDQRVDLAGDGAAVAAEAGHLDTEIDGLAGQRFKPPARLIDREEMQLRPRNIDGKHEIDGATADWHAVAHIDELHLRGGNLLQRRAIQAEDFEAGGPAGTQHEAALRVRRMHPDRDVACGILQTGGALQTGCNRTGSSGFGGRRHRGAAQQRQQGRGHSGHLAGPWAGRRCRAYGI